MSDNLHGLQMAQLMILKDVANVCDANGLKYYLIGGTLLGAVRHKGFIPWDDDVDIVMFRSDYNQLFSIMQSSYLDKYFIQRFDTDVNYTRYIMKIRLNGTKHVEAGVMDVEMHQGIYIDVFPLDYIKGATIDVYVRGCFLRMLFALKNIKHRKYNYHGFKRLLSYLVYVFAFCLSDSSINKFFDYLCCKDNNNAKCRYITNFASHFKWKKQMFPVEYYAEGKYLQFEDCFFRAPKEYIKILERLYGDYLVLPPKEKQVAHNLVEVDLGPYKGND